MKKLFKLKKWLTLKESAKYLTVILDERVTEADLLRLCLDGHLTLSVNLVNHATVKLGNIVGFNDTKWHVLRKEGLLAPRDESVATITDFEKLPKDAAEKIQQIPKEERIHYVLFCKSLIFDADKKEYINLEDGVVTVDGVWDLPMIGAERLDVEHRCQKLSGGPSINLTCLDGPFLKRGEVICQLQENFDQNEYVKGKKTKFKRIEQLISAIKLSKNDVKSKSLHETYLKKEEKNPNNFYYPAPGLPQDLVLIIKTDELRRFEESISDHEVTREKPLQTTERNTLLTIIAAMCKFEGINPNDRGSTTEIVKMTEDLGVPISDDTIRPILKKLQEAVESRQK